MRSHKAATATPRHPAPVLCVPATTQARMVEYRALTEMVRNARQILELAEQTRDELLAELVSVVKA